MTARLGDTDAGTLGSGRIGPSDVGPIHPMLSDAFAGLDRTAVRWCLVRIPGSLARPTGDVDLLVDRSGFERAASVLREHSFVELPRFNQGHSFVRYDPELDAWLWLDITTELVFGTPPLRTGAEQECLRRRRLVSGVWLLEPSDAFWVILLHAAVDGRSLAPRHKAQLVGAAADAKSGRGVLAELGDRLLPSGYSRAEMIDAVMAEDWSAVRHAIGVMRQRAHGLVSGRPIAFLRGAVQSFRRGSSRRRRGLSVALIGADGVGKSTLAAGLIDSFIVPTRLVYMGVWRTPRPFAALGAPGRVGYAIVVQWLRWIYGAGHRMRGRLVIFDRYTEEHLVPPPRPGIVGRLLQGVRAFVVCPAPDLVLLLDTPGAVAFARKQEHSPEEIERIRSRYLRVVDRFPRLTVIDAQQPADVVRRRATEAIWMDYRRRLTDE